MPSLPSGILRAALVDDGRLPILPLNSMKHTLAPLLLLLAPLLASAQDYSNFTAYGLSYSPGASPAIAGTGLYAHRVAGDGTYVFTVVDALPLSVKPFSVSTQFGGGISQKVLTIAGANIYIPTSAGISYKGNNTGWAWTTGALIAIKISPRWRLAPSVRLMKSSVGDYAGYQVIGGVLVGWAW